MKAIAFTAIVELHQPVAFLVEQSLPHPAITALHDLAADKFFNQPELAKRWELPMVLSTDEWAREQLRRQPMFKPSGIRLELLEDAK